MMAFGGEGFGRVPPRKDTDGADIAGLFRRPNECKPVDELPFQMQIGYCGGCSRHRLLKFLMSSRVIIC